MTQNDVKIPIIWIIDQNWDLPVARWSTLKWGMCMQVGVGGRLLMMVGGF